MLILDRVPVEAAKARLDFALFVKLAWPVIEPGTQFVPGKHIDAIAQHLQAVSTGDIKRLLVNMPPRHAKPLYNGSMILMSDGSRKPISDVQIGDFVITHKGCSRKVTDKIEQGMSPCVRITTDYGRSVVAALDHPFLTPEGWVKAGDLQVGMVLANVPSPQTEPCQNDRKLEEFRLAGYFVGDGSCGSNGSGSGFAAMMTTGDPVIAEDLYHCAEVMGFTLMDRGYNRKSGVPVKARRYNFSGGVRDWLRSCGLAHKTSYTKRVPEWVFQGTNEQIAHFIAAYFVCDGTINKKGSVRTDLYAELTSVSRELLADVQHLLLRLGIQSRIAKKSSNYKGQPFYSYRLTLASQDELARFKKLIPLIGGRYDKLAEWTIYRQQFDSPLRADPIVSIEDAGLQPCSCLTVDEDHTYTVDDLVCHNSSLISVLWPVWMWLQDPSLRFLCASYDMPLAVRDNRKCRLLIRSEWFQERYGHLFQLRRDQNEKGNFETDKAGYRIATSVGGGTGKGFDIGIIDDMHPIEQKKGAIKRETALEWFKDTWMTRQNDQQTSRMIVVGQRVHAEDISGFILDGNAGEQWVHLNLPAEYEPDSACRTYIGTPALTEQSVKVKSFTHPHVKSYEVTFTDGKATSCTCPDFTYRQKACKHMQAAKAPAPASKPFWEDWRKLEGELLWPEKFPREVIEKEKRVHGPLGFAALYQQRPVPAGGNIYQKKNARYFTVDWTTETYLLETPRGIKVVPMADCWKLCTVDLAISEAQSSDFFVMAAYAVTPWRDLLLLEIVRDHFTLPEQEEQIVLFQSKYQFQLWAVESVAYQQGLIQIALTKGIPAQPFKVHSDKVLRSGTSSIWHRAGKHYYHKQADWLFEYEKEIYTFPKAPKDDQADTQSMAAIVVCSAIAPGVWDPDDTSFKGDIAQPIEEILDAESIAREKAEQEEAEHAAQPIDPFAFADRVFGGDW